MAQLDTWLLHVRPDGALVEVLPGEAADDGEFVRHGVEPAAGVERRVRAGAGRVAGGGGVAGRGRVAGAGQGRVGVGVVWVGRVVGVVAVVQRAVLCVVPVAPPSEEDD